MPRRASLVAAFGAIGVPGAVTIAVDHRQIAPLDRRGGTTPA